MMGMTLLNWQSSSIHPPSPTSFDMGSNSSMYLSRFTSNEGGTVVASTMSLGSTSHVDHTDRGADVSDSFYDNSKNRMFVPDTSTLYRGDPSGLHKQSGVKDKAPSSGSTLVQANQRGQQGAPRKVASSPDVASVGNASDTLVSLNKSTRLSGRDLHESAKVSFNKGNYRLALEMFESILSAQVRRFGPLHPSVGAAMHNVGVCRQRLHHYELAEELFTEAVQIRRQTLGSENIEVAASLSKLGQVQCTLRKFDDSFQHLREAIVITRRSYLGQSNKMVAQHLSHLACLYYEAGEFYAAEASFHDALEVYRDVWSSLGEIGKVKATSLISLIGTVSSPSPAGEMGMDDASTFTERDGSSTLSTATDLHERNTCMAQLTDTLCNIGSIQNRRKRFNEAISSFVEALDLQRGVFGHDDPRVIATLDNLAYAYSKTKDYDRALCCYQTMYRAQLSRQDGIISEASFETLRKRVLTLEKLKRLPSATTLLRETVEQLDAQRTRHPSTATSTQQLRDQAQALLTDLSHKSPT
jgi:tetratricopeptide (TPR) repeat protein